MVVKPNKSLKKCNLRIGFVDGEIPNWADHNRILYYQYIIKFKHGDRVHEIWVKDCPALGIFEAMNWPWNKNLPRDLWDVIMLWHEKNFGMSLLEFLDVVYK